jgi:hypothetical protein
MNYASLSNNGTNKCMIVKILFKFGLSQTWELFKVLQHSFPFHISIEPKLMTFWMEV